MGAGARKKIENLWVLLKLLIFLFQRVLIDPPPVPHEPLEPYVFFQVNWGRLRAALGQLPVGSLTVLIEI